MASIERTAYPRFKSSPAQQRLHALYTPTDDELTFARKTARSLSSQLSMLVLLKSFQRLGHFPKISDVDSKATNYPGLSKLNKRGIWFITIRRRGAAILRYLQSLPASKRIRFAN